MGAATPSLPLQCRNRTVDPAADMDGARLVRQVGRRVGIAQLVAGMAGALDVFALLWFVLPSPEHNGAYSHTTVQLVNLVAVAVFLLSGAVVGWLWGDAWFRPVRRWLESGRRPTPAERHAALRIPLRCAVISGAGWASAAIGFFLINLPFGLASACHIASTITLGGLTCVPLGYLLTERLARPITARALAGSSVAPTRPGVKGRLVLTWAGATGMILVGLIFLGVHVLADPGDTTVEQLGWSIVVLAAAAVMAGAIGTVLVAKSVAEPLTALRSALTRVEEGDLTARVMVNDASEVGLLQSRFNAMAAGLEEREQLRDLFGRHVGEDVVRSALDGRTQLGGEVRDVAVMFVDLVGSTSLAAQRPPNEVVALLNTFFAVVVDVVGRHGGWVNKFEGDAALAVFGAPGDHADAAGAALTAARELAAAIEPLAFSAGIGVSAGPAVAGNVGAEERFEYTVIGDPVNEAARLCELAKRRDDHVLASTSALDRAVNGEGARWEPCDEVLLRGRTDPTRVAVPTGRFARRTR